jgi:peptidyl-prolyl cis-trans isomerase B (cyclophilin B)
MKKLLSLLLSSLLICTLFLSLSSCGYRRTFKVRMTVKDYGVIDIELDGKAAPITVKNFVKLVKKGFYDGLTFHRVMDGFMIQGGDPNGDGTGGTKPIKGEFLLNHYNNPIAHERGVISMARRGDDYNSGSCQFFIVHQTSLNNTLYLDDQYAAFGRVISGMEVVDAIVKNAEYKTDPNRQLVSNPAVIESIVLLED